jgi:hypothetical protein
MSTRISISAIAAVLFQIKQRLNVISKSSHSFDAPENNSQQDWDRSTVPLAVSGWILRNWQQPTQKENFHTRSLAPSMPSSLSLLSLLSRASVLRTNGRIAFVVFFIVMP